MKRILIAGLLFSGTAFAQAIPDYGFNKIRVTESDKVIQAELKPVKAAPQPEADRFYYWYGGNAIHATQGGFSGRLLNGTYTEYYFNKNLKEQGAFKKGLKEGIWRAWADNGRIVQLYTWKAGVKSGKFNLFDEQGNLKQSGRYHNNSIAVRKSPSFWEKVNIFKKKERRLPRGKDH